jgi:hypothetical protein
MPAGDVRWRWPGQYITYRLGEQLPFLHQGLFPTSWFLNSCSTSRPRMPVPRATHARSACCHRTRETPRVFAGRFRPRHTFESGAGRNSLSRKSLSHCRPGARREHRLLPGVRAVGLIPTGTVTSSKNPNIQPTGIAGLTRQPPQVQRWDDQPPRHPRPAAAGIHASTQRRSPYRRRSGGLSRGTVVECVWTYLAPGPVLKALFRSRQNARCAPPARFSPPRARTLPTTARCVPPASSPCPAL